MYRFILISFVFGVLVETSYAQSWSLLTTVGLPDKRHEACFVMVNGKGYLIGGRGLRQVSEFDPATNTWTNKGVPPQGEMHHMQCLAYEGKIWIAGSWYGPYPTESNHEYMFIYNPGDNTWSKRDYLPQATSRRRGGGAFVEYKGKMYLAMGNRGGHGSQSVTLGMLDEYDPVNNVWSSSILPDAPHPRDHTGGGIVDGRLCVSSGRDGSSADFFNSPVLPTNCFNFETKLWEVEAPIPQGRAGAAVGTNCDGQLMVAGGEGFGNAFKDVDIFDGASWKKGPPLQQGRHGSGFGFASCTSGKIYIASGAGSQGGTYELTTTEAYSPPSSTSTCNATISPTGTPGGTSVATTTMTISTTAPTVASVTTSATTPRTTTTPTLSTSMSTQSSQMTPVLPTSVSYSNKPVLRLYAAGSGGLGGPILTTNAKVCPSDYAAGFTILCLNIPATATSVIFSVNGYFARKEGSAPYAIAGDDLSTGKLFAWTSYPAVATVRCAPNVGDFTEASNVSFSCA